MEPVKKEHTIGAGLAAIGVVLAAAIGVFASTFNPPAQPVAPDSSSVPAATVPTGTPVTALPPSPAAFGSIFPAPATSAISNSTPVTTTTQKTATPASVPAVAASLYKDGTYSATGSYNSPGGEDQVAVTLTLNNDIVTSVTATPKTQDRTSARYQAMFLSGYKQYVVGKDITGIHLSRVSGSSLTSIGFNAAIASIEAEAKA
jgi:uncharacterized protein with FMN-binding domain